MCDDTLARLCVDDAGTVHVTGHVTGVPCMCTQRGTGHMCGDALKHSPHMGAWVDKGCPHGVLRGVQDEGGTRLNITRPSQHGHC